MQKQKGYTIDNLTVIQSGLILNDNVSPNTRAEKCKIEYKCSVAHNKSLSEY